ncbi:DUF559 domain-containing protein [Altererythrobacter indicus]|uniref:DUF559 domain-containing protein n=1 Tax=Altericroceibacterium indicum TaxID=374177 RepID=A0A845ABR5_9SPHN|nr:endonuclease domain-containing protein [Altericroceibacterium indicum]MXP26431.1 DUF559 domain-containing protein [Altericroceibacterium indicum]
MKKTLSLGDAVARQNAGDAKPAPKRSPISPARLDRLHEFARDMRRNPTEAEALLWSHLSESKLGNCRFRQHMIIGSAIVDFACPTRWLVVEVDGDEHDNPGAALGIERKLHDDRIRVIRFTADQVLEDVDAVLRLILEELKKPLNHEVALAAAKASARNNRHGTGPGHGRGRY